MIWLLKTIRQLCIRINCFWKLLMVQRVKNMNAAIQKHWLIIKLNVKQALVLALKCFGKFKCMIKIQLKRSGGHNTIHPNWSNWCQCREIHKTIVWSRSTMKQNVRWQQLVHKLYVFGVLILVFRLHWWINRSFVLNTTMKNLLTLNRAKRLVLLRMFQK